MDDFGDYIYVILIAIAGLSSLLKKKKEKPTPTPVEEEYKPITEDIWEDFLPENPVVRVPEPQTGFFDWEKKETKIATYENTKDVNALRAKKSVERNKSSVGRNQSSVQKAPKKLVIVEEVYPDLNIEFSTVEDARTAFIYAEIFNKKY